MSVVYILIAIMVAALLYISTYFQLLRLRKMSKLKAWLTKLFLIVSVVVFIGGACVLLLHFENERACQAMRGGYGLAGTSCF